MKNLITNLNNLLASSNQNVVFIKPNYITNNTTQKCISPTIETFKIKNMANKKATSVKIATTASKVQNNPNSSEISKKNSRLCFISKNKGPLN